MANFTATGATLNMYTANVGALLSTATGTQTTTDNWTLMKGVDWSSSFMGSDIVYNQSNLPVSGTLHSWIYDDYVPAGVVGWTAFDFTAAANSVVSALQANDAKTLFGLILSGNDLVTGSNKGDLLDGFLGNDTVMGGGGNDQLFGSDGNDKLRGQSGNDTLSGGNGHDVLTGGAGSDTFIFNASPTLANADRVSDFNPLADHIQLSSAIFKALPHGVLADDQFVIGTAATTTSQHIIFDMATGHLYYDADGSGTANVQHLIATITTAAPLLASDFFIV